MRERDCVNDKAKLVPTSRMRKQERERMHRIVRFKGKFKDSRKIVVMRC